MDENELPECFLAFRSGDQTFLIALPPEARYAQDFTSLRIWDRGFTYVVNPDNLVALRLRNLGPVGKGGGGQGN